MSDNCCADTCGTGGALTDKRWRLILWIALTLNAAMFFIEMGAGVQTDLRALQADALDFFGDAANYAISNVAVLAAALGVLRTGSAWHDLGVAGIVADWPSPAVCKLCGKLAGH